MVALQAHPELSITADSNRQRAYCMPDAFTSGCDHYTEIDGNRPHLAVEAAALGLRGGIVGLHHHERGQHADGAPAEAGHDGVHLRPRHRSAGFASSDTLVLLCS